MRKVDLYWMSNRDWWEVHNFVITLKEDAPEEAQISYDRYLLQEGLDCLYALSCYQDRLLRIDNGHNTADILYLCRYFESLKTRIKNEANKLCAVRIFRNGTNSETVLTLMKKYHLN